MIIVEAEVTSSQPDGRGRTVPKSNIQPPGRLTKEPAVLPSEASDGPFLPCCRHISISNAFAFVLG